MCTGRLILQECYNSEFIWLVWACLRKVMKKQDFCNKHLHNYFFSTRNETEKIQRLEHFLGGVFLIEDFRDLENFKQIIHDPKYRSKYLYLFMMFSKIIAENNIPKFTVSWFLT